VHESILHASLSAVAAAANRVLVGQVVQRAAG
jgi:hypothetical protein